MNLNQCVTDGCSNDSMLGDKYCRECKPWLNSYAEENSHLR